MQKWWERRAQEAVDDHDTIIMQVPLNSTIGEEKLVGYVVLGKPVPKRDRSGVL
jgi:hypothetical protein